MITVLCSCGKEVPPVTEYNFKIVSSDENNAILEWQSYDSDGTVNLSVDTDDTFKNPVLFNDIALADGETNITGLSPMTLYKVKIEVVSNGEIIWSKVMQFSSSYTMELVQYNSTLNAEICANLCYISNRLSEKSKVVVFMYRYRF